MYICTYNGPRTAVLCIAEEAVSLLQDYWHICSLIIGGWMELTISNFMISDNCMANASVLRDYILISYKIHTVSG